MPETADLSPDHSACDVTCPLCERTVLDRRHCKSICPGSGYVESCEDNFIPNRANPDEPSGFAT